MLVIRKYSGSLFGKRINYIVYSFSYSIIRHNFVSIMLLPFDIKADINKSLPTYLLPSTSTFICVNFFFFARQRD